MPNETVQSPSHLKAPVPPNVPSDRIYDVDMYALDGLGEGYHEAWKKVQQPGVPDLIWTPYTGGHWIATRARTVREVYSDPTRFSSENIWLPKEAGEKYAMVPTVMDPPEHTPYRKALDSVLRLGQIRNLEAPVRAAAADLVARIAPAGGCEFTKAYAKVFPIQVFMGLANLPMEDVPHLIAWRWR